MVTAMTCHGRARDRCFLVLYCRGSWVVGRRDGNVKGMRHVRLILFLLVMPVSSSSSWSSPSSSLPPSGAVDCALHLANDDAAEPVPGGQTRVGWRSG